MLMGCQYTNSNVKVTEKSTTEQRLEPIVKSSMEITMEPTIKIPLSAPDIIKEETYTIVIDAGHQSRGNSKLEPIGPGAKNKKKKVSSGTQGVVTKVAEYKVNLAVSLLLRDILVEQGYDVVMIRETNDVNISNAQRAKIANASKADAFIRIHCNGSEDKSVNGALTICPTKNNPYCSDIYKDSWKLSKCILSGLCDNTGAKKRSIMKTDSMTGINWCEVPVTIVEMGYMTNAKEDRNLNKKAYQKKIAMGIANGLKDYFE